MKKAVPDVGRPAWNEADRLAALQGYDVLDTDPDPVVDSLARIAARSCNAPIALVSLVDESRQWFKGGTGLEMREIPREISICVHTILQSEVFVVPDTTQDARFRDNPLVTGEPYLRFYAGALLETEDGLPLGTLCILDRAPRPEGLMPEETESLLTLARAVMSHLGLRRSHQTAMESERKFRTTTDAIPQMVWSARPDGQIDYYNQRWYQFTGVEHDPEGRAGRRGIVHPDDRESVRAKWRRSLQAGEEYEVEFRQRHFSGAYRWVLGRALPMRNAQGEVERWFGTCTDIHDLKQAQQALAENQEFTRRLLASSNDCIKVLDLDGTLRFMSEGGQRVMEVQDFCQIEGSHWPDFWSGRAGEDARAAVEAAKAGGTGRFQGFCATVAGTPKWWDVLVTAIRDLDGRPERLLSISRDITESKLAEDRITEAAERYRLAAQATDDAIWDWDLTTGHIQWNEAVQTIFGYPLEEVDPSERWWAEQLHPEDREQVVQGISDALNGDRTHWSAEYRFRRIDGTYASVLDRGYVLRDETGGAVRMIGAVLDMSERKRAEEALRASEERLRLALQAARMVAWEQDLRTGHVTRSGNSLELLGIGSGPVSDFIDRADPEYQPLRRGFLDRINKDGVGTIEFRYQRTDGKTLWLASRGEKAGPDRIVGVSYDITERKEAEEELRRLASHDTLTGLPNRRLFQWRLEKALAKARRKGSRIGLILIDLDGFKDVNDSFGHDAGDALLVETASRLRSLIRKHDTVARLGGDEFAILLAGETEPNHTAAIAESIRRKLSQPLSHAGQMILSRTSIGTACFPDRHAEPAELMKNADIALYRAKTEGRNRVVAYSPEMRAAIEHRIALRRDMREAISRDRISPFYQAKVCLSTGEIVGFEALARWEHPTKGLLTPSTFGDAFDDPELASVLGKRLIGKVASDMRRWLGNGLSFGHVAINLSHAEFIQPNLAEDVLRILDLAKVPMDRFEIEVTERVLLDTRSEGVASALEKFRRRGVRIALDDFGTGYASLTHLQQFDFDHIKIDQSFVRDIQSNPGNEAIAAAVVGLGRSLNLQVTAEGIETEGQAQRLQEIGCGIGQGYLFARPVPASEVPGLLSGWTYRLMQPGMTYRAAALGRD